MANAPNLPTDLTDDTQTDFGTHAGLHNDANREINKLSVSTRDAELMFWMDA